MASVQGLLHEANDLPGDSASDTGNITGQIADELATPLHQRLARARRAGSRSALTSTSGPIPPGSPREIAMVGRSVMRPS